MEDYIINVGKIEEMQMINDRIALDLIFRKAHSSIVCGAKVILEREDPSGKTYRFEEFTSLDDLKAYKKNVYKLLGQEPQ
jgi:hypothetical protein